MFYPNFKFINGFIYVGNDKLVNLNEPFARIISRKKSKWSMERLINESESKYNSKQMKCIRVPINDEYVGVLYKTWRNNAKCFGIWRTTTEVLYRQRIKAIKYLLMEHINKNTKETKKIVKIINGVINLIIKKLDYDYVVTDIPRLQKIIKPIIEIKNENFDISNIIYELVNNNCKKVLIITGINRQLAHDLKEKLSKNFEEVTPICLFLLDKKGGYRMPKEHERRKPPKPKTFF